LLSPLSYKPKAIRNFMSGKSDVYVLVAAARRGFKMVLRPTTAATLGFTMVSFTEEVTRRNPFVGGTCASLSALPVWGDSGGDIFVVGAEAVVASHPVPNMFAMMRLPWQRPLLSNSALNIQQLWASRGRTREPISMKFGTQQQIRNSMTVTWSNIIFFKFKMATPVADLKF